MVSFIKKLTVHVQFLVFNKTRKTYKKNLKETLISVSIKKKYASLALQQNLPILPKLKKKSKKKELTPSYLPYYQGSVCNFRPAIPTKKKVKTFLKIQKKELTLPYLPYYQSPVCNFRPESKVLQ